MARDPGPRCVMASVALGSPLCERALHNQLQLGGAAIEVGAELRLPLLDDNCVPDVCSGERLAVATCQVAGAFCEQADAQGGIGPLSVAKHCIWVSRQPVLVVIEGEETASLGECT